jgi:hypothetical protein
MIQRKSILVGFAALLLLTCITGCKNELGTKVETLELHYITWGCECANWATPEDIDRFENSADDSLALYSIFLEPASPELELPDTIGWNNDVIRVTGTFYKRRGFPRDYVSFMPVDKARVFRYTSYAIIRSNHAEGIRYRDSFPEAATPGTP